MIVRAVIDPQEHVTLSVVCIQLCRSRLSPHELWDIHAIQIL